MRIEQRALAADDAGDVRLQLGVERRLDAPARVVARRGEHHLDEVRRRERRLYARVKASRSSAASRAWSGGDRAGRLHAPQHRPLPRERRRRVSVRVEPVGRCGRPARNAACAGVSIDASWPK